LLSLISHRVKDVKDGVGSSHEVWVIGIDIGVLNCNEVFNHLVTWLERLVKEIIHDLNDAFTQVLESVELG
jgi:hypothetical protein